MATNAQGSQPKRKPGFWGVVSAVAIVAAGVLGSHNPQGTNDPSQAVAREADKPAPAAAKDKAREAHRTVSQRVREGAEFVAEKVKLGRDIYTGVGGTWEPSGISHGAKQWNSNANAITENNPAGKMTAECMNAFFNAAGGGTPWGGPKTEAVFQPKGKEGAGSRGAGQNAGLDRLDNILHGMEPGQAAFPNYGYGNYGHQLHSHQLGRA